MRCKIINLPVEITHDTVVDLAAELKVKLLEPPCIQSGYAVELNVEGSFSADQLSAFESAVRNYVISKIGKIIPLPD